MKTLLIPFVAVVAMFATSCKTTDIQHYVGPPIQVQNDTAYIGGRVKQYMSPDAKAKLHQAGTLLQSASTGDIAPILALFPSHTGNTVADLFIANAKTTLELVASMYATTLPTLLEYFHALGAGLLANF